MIRFNKFLAATFLSAATLFTGSLQAMEIRQFDKMADQDQADYITVLVRGAEKVLNDEGRSDLAARMEHLRELAGRATVHDHIFPGGIRLWRGLVALGEIWERCWRLETGIGFRSPFAVIPVAGVASTFENTFSVVWLRRR